MSRAKEFTEKINKSYSLIPPIDKWIKYKDGGYSYKEKTGYLWAIQPREGGFSLSVRDTSVLFSSWDWIIPDGEISPVLSVSKENLFPTAAAAVKAAQKVEL